MPDATFEEPTVPDIPTPRQPVPDKTCDVAGCTEPAAVMTRSATAMGLVPEPAAELVPLCARHAEQAEARKASPVDGA